MNACKHIKKNKESCRAPPVKGSDYCFWHSPKEATARAEARRKGGCHRQVKKRSSNNPSYRIKGVADIQKILEDTLNDAAGLENSHARARTLGYLCQIALKAVEVGELENRIAALEQRINKK